MSLPPNFVEGLALDHLGRVILTDDILDQLDTTSEVLSAGANQSCSGSTNGTCSNGACGQSTNGFCSNTFACNEASNTRFCQDSPLG